MEDEAVGVVVFLGIAISVAAIVVAVLAAAHSQAQTLSRTYAELARRRRGTATAAAMFSYPTMRFVHAGAQVLVDVFSTGGKNAKYFTQFHIAWPDPGFRCEIYPEGFFQRVGKFFGMEDLEIGSSRFDEAYIICGNSAAELRTRLTGRVQQIIDELRRLLYNDDIYISVAGSMMLVKKRSVIREQEKLDRFITLSLALYDELLAAHGSGIEFLAAPAIVSSSAPSDAICQICGEPIGVGPVYCQSCRTPHHEDCWRYYGACSTYGCGQKHFVKK